MQVNASVGQILAKKLIENKLIEKDTFMLDEGIYSQCLQNKISDENVEEAVIELENEGKISVNRILRGPELWRWKITKLVV